MRHLIAGRKLGRTTPHRWALFSNMASSLVTHERIETTLPKAKEIRSLADRLITLGKENSLHARRQVFALIRSKPVVRKLFTELAPRFKDRQGGYTRILKLGYRLGDAAPMALIEYLPGEGPAVVPVPPPPKKKAKKETKPSKKGLKSADVKKEAAKKEGAKKETVKKEEPKKETKSWFRRTFFGK